MRYLIDYVERRTLRHGHLSWSLSASSPSLQTHSYWPLRLNLLLTSRMSELHYTPISLSTTVLSSFYRYGLASKLWIVIIFEHIVFVLKFLIAFIIPDVPKHDLIAAEVRQYRVSLLPYCWYQWLSRYYHHDLWFSYYGVLD